MPTRAESSVSHRHPHSQQTEVGAKHTHPHELWTTPRLLLPPPRRFSRQPQPPLTLAPARPAPSPLRHTEKRWLCWFRSPPRTGHGSRNLQQPDPRRKTLWTTHWSPKKTHRKMGVSGFRCRGGHPASDLTLGHTEYLQCQKDRHLDLLAPPILNPLWMAVGSSGRPGLSQGGCSHLSCSGRW
ncbi:hypothetical protein CapIbe_004173 [Capra ibex]